MDDPDLLREVVTCFLEDTPRLIAGLMSTSVHGDSAAAGAQAHSLKGAAANVGGVALSEASPRWSVRAAPAVWRRSQR